MTAPDTAENVPNHNVVGGIVMDPCCCNCQSQAVDLSHPLTDGGRVIHQRGWVCLAPEFDHSPSPVLIGSEERITAVVSGFSQHGLCEMWNRRP